MRPDRSVIVPEIMTGIFSPRASSELGDGVERGLGVERVENRFHEQKVDAAFEQGRRLLADKRALSSSKVVARKPGLFTSGEIEAVRLVGPIAPAT